MSREAETYRPILESILSEYGKHILSTSDVMKFTGRGRDWCKAHLDLNDNHITAEKLAIQLSKL